MIRRELRPKGGSSQWLLVPQVEHASLAWALARAWGLLPFVESTSRNTLVQTIRRHDDGWADWDQQPQVDPQTGKPRAFTEMPLQAAHDIWTRSIDSCRDLGPLAQFLVAAHFIALRRHGDSSASAEAIRFVDKFERRCQEWLLEWQSLEPTQNTLDAARRALRFLQMFDEMSLWFCCADRNDDKPFQDPDGQTFVYRPVGSSHVTCSPWPFRKSQILLSVTGRVVPRTRYTGSDHLAQMPQQNLSLSWELMPNL
ncbi:MAG: hypothetical protein CMJ81_16180 [Planctomycetaceae bacterium]|nr:hypothetical protein [Planctomycetaceae bacterium]MBP63813.1 hypothetical protein [Planctomycetaceae bacterium]